MAPIVLVACLVLGAPADYRVVLRSGRVLTVRDAPAVSGDRLIAALPDGSVVRLPLAGIDRPATERLNPGRALRRVRPRAVAAITNLTLEEHRRAHPPQPVPSTGAVSSVSTAAPPETSPSADEERSPAVVEEQAPDQPLWRGRARELRDRRRRLERAVEAARASLRDAIEVRLYGRTVGSEGESFRVTHYLQSAEELAVVELRISQLGEKLDALEGELAEARQREADLRKEAREAGVPAGWLRVAEAI